MNVVFYRPQKILHASVFRHVAVRISDNITGAWKIELQTNVRVNSDKWYVNAPGGFYTVWNTSTWKNFKIPFCLCWAWISSLHKDILCDKPP